MENNLLSKPLLTKTEVAEVLGCSISTVHRLIRSGELQTQKLGVKLVRIPAASVNAFMGKGGAK